MQPKNKITIKAGRCRVTKERVTEYSYRVQNL